MLELAAPWWLLAVPLPGLAWWSTMRIKSSKCIAATTPAIRHAQADVLLNLIGNMCRHSGYFYKKLQQNAIIKQCFILCED